jgi:hypothetical protein
MARIESVARHYLAIEERGGFIWWVVARPGALSGGFSPNLIPVFFRVCTAIFYVHLAQIRIFYICMNTFNTAIMKILEKVLF